MINSITQNHKVVSVILAVFAAVFAVALLVNATTIGNSITVTTDLTVDGNSTLGNAVADSITATGYFTQVRVGTGTTFEDIGAVGADELGVEGAVEIDGLSSLDGGFVSAASSTVSSTLSVGGALTASSTLQATGATRFYDTFRADGLSTLAGFISTASSTAVSTLTVSGVFSASSTALLFGVAIGDGGVTFEDLGAIGADELGVEGAMEVNGLATLDGGFISTGSSTAVNAFNIGGAVKASSTLEVSSQATFSGNVAVGTSTPAQEVAVVGDLFLTSAATTTNFLRSTGSNSGGCIEMQRSNGGTVRLYVSPTTTSATVSGLFLVVEAGNCQ